MLRIHPLTTLIIIKVVITIYFGCFCYIYPIDLGKDENSEAVFNADMGGNHKYFVSDALITVTAQISDKFCHDC